VRLRRSPQQSESTDIEIERKREPTSKLVYLSDCGAGLYVWPTVKKKMSTIGVHVV
jgi:hypothetical protein